MNIKNGDILPDAKVFILDKDPKEVLIKEIIGDEQNLSHKGLGIRSSRYSMLVEKGKVIKISEEEIVGKCEISAVENFLKEI